MTCVDICEGSDFIVWLLNIKHKHNKTSILSEGKVTYKQNVSTRVGTVKKQNLAISMITRLYKFHL